MLLSFSVSNYKNFKDKQTLNFVNKKNKEVLPIIAIYGENGSGKSNLLKALFLLKNIITRPITQITPISEISNDIFLSPFKLHNDYITEPSRFEIEFITNSKRFKYILECNKKQVVFEELDELNEQTNRYSFIYKRQYDLVIFNEKLKISQTIRSIINNKYNEFSRYINVLFLSLLWNERINPAYDIFMFFATKLFIFPTIINDGESNGISTLEQLKKPINKQKIINFLNSVNINIDDIEIRDREVDIKKNGVLFETQTDVDSVKFLRKNNNNKLVYFDFLMEESTGTQKLFALTGDLLNALESGEITVIFDELDKALHIDLLLSIINLFNNKNTNKNSSQLIFTTHNTTLLSNRYNLFPNKEQVCIIDKKYSGESEIYSLDNVGGIGNKSKENLFLNGQLGGVPSLVEFNI